MFDKYKARYQKFEQDHESVRKVKAHLEKHKVFYAAAGSSGLTLVAVQLFGGPKVIVREVPNLPTVISPIFNNVPVFNNTVNNGGHMRKIVRCLETGELWLSVTEAAKAQGKNIALMSQHLNHPDVVEEINGMHFVIEALATS